LRQRSVSIRSIKAMQDGFGPFSRRRLQFKHGAVETGPASQ
jgi:hypothetical protein